MQDDKDILPRVYMYGLEKFDPYSFYHVSFHYIQQEYPSKFMRRWRASPPLSQVGEHTLSYALLMFSLYYDVLLNMSNLHMSYALLNMCILPSSWGGGEVARTCRKSGDTLYRKCKYRIYWWDAKMIDTLRTLRFTYLHLPMECRDK
jgi:hypothetical protein